MKQLAWALAALLVLAVTPLAFAVVFAASVITAAAASTCTLAGMPATGTWRPPFQQGYTTTDGFGMRLHPIHGDWRMHTGQDLASTPDAGPVVAASAGTVAAAGVSGGYGNLVVLDHGDGVRTYYGHLARIDAAVTAGASVWMGQRLGVEGSTGTSTGDHLHFEVRVDGDPVDPVPFMLAHGAPLNGVAVAASPSPSDAITVPAAQEGGIGYPLPEPGTPRLASLHNPPLPIPADVKALYVAAADRYHLPWTVLAGVGMEETAHGKTTATSSAGAQGLMQFMPATWATYGVDGDGDGKAVITNPADSVMSAANYLTAAGLTTGGAEGVRRALLAYNHADWYVNDVLYYAHAYGGGVIAGDPSDCGPGGQGDPSLTAVSSPQVATMLTWALSHAGDRYVFGASGPHAWDCSGFTQAAYAQIGVSLPRTASAQRNWLAAGHGSRVTPGQEQPGDLIFIDTYLGPNAIGHVQIVLDPATQRTVEALSTRYGVGSFTYRYTGHSIFEIWRVGQPTQRTPA